MIRLYFPHFTACFINAVYLSSSRHRGDFTVGKQCGSPPGNYLHVHCCISQQISRGNPKNQ
uniref:Uncharacterized protein n=1 Tax=Takifugu rubripes TaxID=31033 RepID=A0A3B5JYP2_TAKRU